MKKQPNRWHGRTCHPSFRSVAYRPLPLPLPWPWQVQLELQCIAAALLSVAVPMPLSPLFFLG